MYPECITSPCPQSYLQKKQNSCGSSSLKVGGSANQRFQSGGFPHTTLALINDHHDTKLGMLASCQLQIRVVSQHGCNKQFKTCWSCKAENQSQKPQYIKTIPATAKADWEINGLFLLFALSRSGRRLRSQPPQRGSPGLVTKKKECTDLQVPFISGLFRQTLLHHMPLHPSSQRLIVELKMVNGDG